ncbi:hypothetical protein T4B_11685 [Trichinella pseudospiralis]|uniref:Uncharacterized protein n=1 Tax=Trichinella pseudospiralis TaxID=6337 RepID=A0A0V1IFQ3_TRIPS|nr:hypothetical protein T4B_11685 [Trichinella pseudospiralis]
MIAGLRKSEEIRQALSSKHKFCCKLRHNASNSSRLLDGRVQWSHHTRIANGTNITTKGCGVVKIPLATEKTMVAH